MARSLSKSNHCVPALNTVMQLRKYNEWRRSGYERVTESDIANELASDKATLLDRPDTVRASLR